MPDPTVVYTEGDQPEPVTAETPLEGLETTVLAVWKDASPAVRKAHKANPQRVEQAVRQAVHVPLVEELRLRTTGWRSTRRRSSGARRCGCPRGFRNRIGATAGFGGRSFQGIFGGSGGWRGSSNSSRRRVKPRNAARL